jgi:exodeoxyribonuclease VII large subunit
VGHETDFTIADFVANRRVSTPTRASEVCPDIREVLANIETAGRHLIAAATGSVAIAGQQLNTVRASAAFRNPRLAVNMATTHVDESAMRLATAAKDLLVLNRNRVEALQNRVARIEPHRLIATRTANLTSAANSMTAALRKQAGTAELILTRHENAVSTAAGKRLVELQLRLTASENRLGALDPRSILTRGYTITRNKRTGKVVLAAADVECGDMMQTELANKNLIESQVKTSQNRETI